jgi:hypothetical protein
MFGKGCASTSHVSSIITLSGIRYSVCMLTLLGEWKKIPLMIVRYYLLLSHIGTQDQNELHHFHLRCTLCPPKQSDRHTTKILEKERFLPDQNKYDSKPSNLHIYYGYP